MLFRCEERMGKAIPEEDLTAGKLAQYLKPEDYRPIKQVSKPLLYLVLIGSCCWLAFSGVSFPLSVIPKILALNVKTRPPSLRVCCQLPNLCKSSHFGAPCTRRGFLRTNYRLSYDLSYDK